MPTTRSNTHTQLVSFSGMDGAGKSTQIEALCHRLEEEGLRVRIIRFWDEIAKLTRLRESASHRIFNSESGIGTPSTPIKRRDKNIRSRPMTAVRLFIYFLDAISLRGVVKQATRSEADVLIFDRYIYDEFANLTLSNSAIRAYVRLIIRLAPRPHLSYLLDAIPSMARARKPEYPLEFLKANREWYKALSDLIGGITIIPPMPLTVVTQLVINHALGELSFNHALQQNEVVKASNASSAGSAKLDGAPTRPAAI